MMAINFTKAIELQVVRKLKSHAKVGYQDHPNGDKRCSGCSMFVDGNPPACTHVAPPIASHGYCDDYEPLDPNARARAAIGKAKSFAEVLKDGPPDEARDNQGKWTTGSGAGQGTTRQSGRTGGRIAGRRGQSVSTYLDAELRREERQQARDEKQMKDAQQKVDDLQRQLSEHSQDKSEDLYWGVHRMLQQARDDLQSLQSAHKAYSPDEPRDAKGMWTSEGGGISSGTAANIHGAVEGNDIAGHASKVDDAHQTLDQAMTEASYAEEVAQEHQDNHGEQDPELESAAVAAQKTAAEAAVELHQHLSDLHQATGDAMARIEQHLSASGIHRVGKNMTVGDVHATTALGNQPPNKRKAKDFLTTIGEIKGARVMAVPAMDFGKALEKIKADALASAATIDFVTALGNAVLAKVDWDELSKRTVSVLFMRHGPTRFNNQTDMSKDRVRSWNNVPLTAEGIEDAEKAGEKLAKQDIGYIVSSDLGRAIQTSKLVGKAVGIKPIHDYGMRPWNLGKFTGQTTDEAHDGILEHVENPDEMVDGGESFNTFKARAAQAMLSHIKKAGKKKMLVVSHHRNERLFAAMRPDGTVDAKKFMKAGEDPGDFVEMEFSTDELQNALRSAKEDHGEAKVGKVWGSNAELPDGVRNVLPQEAQTVWRKVANDRIKAGQSEKSAIRQAWTAVKNGWSKTKDGWMRKTWLESDGVHEFLDAELAKLGGSTSSIAKPTDQVNVSLQLIPLDDQNARSPFPYDQYFFSDLRNDQKERVLAALTDQDSLEEREIPLSMLSAVQDRVDPGKIQSMIEGATEKRPVVVRIGPGRYCIVDGHHRLTAAKLSGVKTVTVKYLDIEDYDPRVHTDENQGSKGEPVNKAPDMEIEFDVRKTDEDQQLVFGWASICSIGGEDVVDKQDDIIPEDELEKAAYDFALYCRQQGDMHERMGVGRLVESMMFTKQKQEALGVDLGLTGWWIGFRVDDPGVWKRIKAGELPEFSIGGKARRETVDA